MQINVSCSPVYGAIVLAAGVSRRMGICKASLAWGEGKTLLSYQIEQFLLAGMKPIVVLGPHNADRQQDCPPGTSIAIVPTPDRGKTCSILTGLQFIPKDLQVLAISAVDQPRPTEVYQKLLRSQIADRALITAPCYQGKLGHPLFFDRQALPYLQNLREETFGLRQIVKEFYDQIQRLEFDTPVILSDINTPEEYDNLQNMMEKLGNFG